MVEEVNPFSMNLHEYLNSFLLLFYIREKLYVNLQKTFKSVTNLDELK